MNTDTPPQPAHGEPKSQTISEAFGLTPESFTAYRKAVKASGMSLEEYAMTHSGVEVHSKETMDEVRWALKSGLKVAEHCNLNATAYIREMNAALAKLNPPQ